MDSGHVEADNGVVDSPGKKAARKPKQTAARPPARPTPAAADTLVHSEGQRLLLAVPGSLRDIAAAVGCSSRQTVSDWRSGKKIPGDRYREQLHAVYGIAETAWSIIPGAQLQSSRAAAPSKPEDVASGPAPTSTIEHCLILLETIRAARSQPGLVPRDRVKLASEEAKILALRHRLEKEQELQEDRVVREHPAWLRIKAVLVRALAPHPAAAQAVATALLELEETPTPTSKST